MGTRILQAAAAFIGLGIFILVMLAVAYIAFSWGRVRRWRQAAVFLAPGIIGTAVLVGFPLLFSIYLAGTNLSMRRVLDHSFSLAHYVENFRWLMFEARAAQGFPAAMARTAVWALFQLGLGFGTGLLLALALVQPLRLRALFKFLLLLPWAMPGIILILSLGTEFHYEFGFVNNLLNNLMGIRIRWNQDRFWNLISMHMVGLYLAIPYYTLVIEGALRGMQPSYLEAAELDGAGPFRRLRSITLPIISPVLWPPVLFSLLGLFSTFDLPYLMAAQGNELISVVILELALRSGQYARSAMAGWLFSLVMGCMLLGLIRFGRVLPKEIIE
ncbi:carbohydrate ABC transporter permease [Spirochaeta africana]|uniref:Permease component of ABC-type sugar transporter n=1 Tax=Spirochaeta africana (strain ATCC 700263 / DSM 8902 / Z-7692) TaxID=889378 RepID=H9UM58_SPIAZ|nr:sugar ABC transporter permease [Spirochaeta africana]AFG38601.1 permease component of ABC-type sugar transporter [Spirochaeta africana DSM 8902]